MWFILSIIGYFLLALVVILDKLIVSKSSQKPIVYTFYSTFFMFGVLLFLPFFGFELLGGTDWWWAIISGVAYGIALWTFYKGVFEGEASHIGPFNGAVFTVAMYALSNIILGENLTPAQMIGTAILGLACLSLSFERSRKHRGFHIGFFWAGVSGILFALSHVSAAYLYRIYPFAPALIWTRATTGLVGLFLLLFPSVRYALKHKTKAKTYARKHAGAIIVLDKVLSVLAILLLQIGYATGIVTIVGAVGGVQYAFTFAMILVLTKFLPKVFKEDFTKRELIVEIFATILVVIGSALFVL